ncbi:hypothetical protein C1I95_14780 [Micromonospora craterilacus]|uniref:Uncharacterized protein n=1 Tax=Micromonospora craterilacus TaxID=1655439 RepID=A0A2W2E1E9_9ACTN|nr:hypothetical protein [Micromonospora craterilacus]PZG17812.1 hypothetical protein C1I95_14780 [Micromonospora craterilacus]
MTRAPANLLAVRRLLLDHLDRDPNRVRDADLEPGEVGIVGDANHRGGYHCGSDRVVSNDYSVVESPRDRDGLTLDAAALDVGMFEVSAAGKTHTLQTFSTWCVAQCVANAPDTRDIREIIYSPDGRTVRRWDRLGRRSTGDVSHRWHTHFSFFRDSIKANRDQTPLFRRYLTTVGLIKPAAPAVTPKPAPAPPKEPDMTPDETKQLREIHTMLSRLDGREAVGMAYLRLAEGKDHRPDAKPVSHPTLTSLGAQLTAVQTALTALAKQRLFDPAVIVSGVLAGLDAEAIAAAIPSTVAEQVATELARRLAG